MSDITFIALMLGVGIGLFGCCFCSYFVSKCMFGIKIVKPQETIQSKPLEIIVMENPMHSTEDPVNFT